MTNPLLIVIPFNNETAARAERLIDFIYHLNDRQQEHHAMIVATHGVSMEWQTKIAISAANTFEAHELFRVGDKSNVFSEASAHIKETYKSPFLWLEPFNVPLRKGWIEEIETAYNSQPKRYMGAHLKDGSERLWLSRTAVYPSDVDTIQMELLGSLGMISRSTKTRLIQHLNYEGQQHLDKIREDAVILCSDKTGTLQNTIFERIEKERGEALAVSSRSNGHESMAGGLPKRRGRPPKVTQPA